MTDDAFRDRLLAVTEENPMPEGEWAPLRDLLGDELLARLLSVSEGSLRRYAAGQRTTPDPVAARLHWVALAVADLEGSYNALGVRRWFARPRTVLADRSPQDHLERGFDPDGAAAAEVRSLARSLTGLGATRRRGTGSATATAGSPSPGRPGTSRRRAGTRTAVVPRATWPTRPTGRGPSS